MKSVTKEVEMNAPKNRSLFSIHKQVEDFVKESGVQEGLVFIGCMIDASVFIDTDPPDKKGLREESLSMQLRNIVPYAGQTDDGLGLPVYNLLTRQVLGKDVVVPITNGKLHINNRTTNTICYYDNVLFSNDYKAVFLMKIIGE